MNEMKTFGRTALVCAVMLAASILAQDTKPADAPGLMPESWTRMLKDAAERGKLQAQLQTVRGDSGKWNDKATLQIAPSWERKPAGLSLDNWAELLAKEKPKLTAGEETWLIFRTRQLDNNDRPWVEKIGRRGNRFIVEMSQATWQGYYGKNFTYYNAYGLNLGKLRPGEYEAKWIVRPLVFRQFGEAPDPKTDLKDRWPKDARPAAAKPAEFIAKFTVAAP